MQKKMKFGMFLHQFLPYNTNFISSTLFPFGVWVGKKKSPEKTTNFIGFLETRPKINKKGVFTLKFVILMGTF